MVQTNTDIAPAFIQTGEPQVLYDLAKIINSVYQLNIEPTKEDRIPKRLLNKIQPSIKMKERLTNYGDNNLTIDMLLKTLQTLRIVQLSDPPITSIKPRYETGSYYPSWAHMNAVSQTRLILQSWMNDHIWIDVAPIPDEREIRDINYFDNWMYIVSINQARQTMIEHLSEYTAGEWYNLENFLHHIWKESPLGALSTAISKYESETRKREWKKYEPWRKKHQNFYYGFLYSSLYEMGIINLGFEGSETTKHAPQAFQISEFGSEVLASELIETAEQENTQADLIIQPTFEILLLENSLPTLYKVLPFVQVKQIGIVSSLQLTKTSVLQARKNGIKQADIIGHLTKSSQREIPQNVLYSLQDWFKQYKEARLSLVIQIEIEDEGSIQKLIHTERFQQWGIKQVGPGIITLDGNADLQTVRNNLEKADINTNLAGKFPNYIKKEL